MTDKVYRAPFWELIDHAGRVRFWSYVDKSTDGCWRWTRALLPAGYGSFGVRGWRAGLAHRIAYELATRTRIPDGLHLDHLCRVRRCVNPSHLEIVTRKENILRGVGFAARNAAKTHCKLGHELSGDNLIPSQKARTCRICHNARQNARRAVDRERVNAWQRKWRAERKLFRLGG